MKQLRVSRLAAALLSLTLALSLAACGGRGGTLPEGDTPPPTGTLKQDKGVKNDRVQQEAGTKYSQEALAALDLLYQCMEAEPQLVFAAAYLGYRDAGETAGLSDWLMDNVPGLTAGMPFLQEIPESCVLGGDSGELYCIVPRSGETSMTVNRIQWESTGNGVEPSAEEILYRSEQAEPVLVFCRYEQFRDEPNVEIQVVNDHGAALTWYPLTDPEYGAFVLPTDENDAPLILDFSRFGDVGEPDPEGDWWLPPTDEGLADTCWVCEYWSMELRRGGGDPEYAGTAEIYHRFEDTQEEQLFYSGVWRMEDDCLRLELSAGVGSSHSGSYPVLIDPSGEQLYIQQARDGMCPPFFDEDMTSMSLALSYG